MTEEFTCPNCGFPHQCRNAEMERDRREALEAHKAHTYLDLIGAPSGTYSGGKGTLVDRLREMVHLKDIVFTRGLR